MGLWEIIAIIAAIVLLPIIPAYILYKALPDEAFVRGPLKGFNIQLNGAYAGYFATLLLMIVFCSTLLPRISKYEPWTVEGTIRLEDKGSTIENTRILVKPPNQDIYPDGRFFIKNILLPENKGAEKPSLIIQKEGYKVETLILSEEPPYQKGFINYSIKYSIEDKTIRISKPIVLEQKVRMIEYTEKGACAARPIEEKVP